jgi:dihydrofolate reductase
MFYSIKNKNKTKMKMRKLVLFMHTSLDGFTTDSKGKIDWIQIEDEMFDYAGQRTNEADTALYGRGTYQIMESYWPTAADKPGASKHDIEHSGWYNHVDKIVVSKTLKPADHPQIRIISENLVTEIRKLKQKTGKDIIMFGSPTLAQSLMQENLIDDYWLLMNPILLGQGNPLFRGLKNEIKLKLILSKTFVSGVVCLHFEAITGNNI